MPDFRILADYYLINGGAHLQPPALVAPPALTYHAAFWRTIPDGSESVAAEANDDPRESWLRSVDSFLASFVRTAYERGDAEHPGARDTRRLFRHRVTGLANLAKAQPMFEKLVREEIEQYRNETFSFSFTFHDIPMELRAVLHSEFVTLTIIAKLRPPSEDANDDEIRTTLSSCFRVLAVRFPQRLRSLLRGRRDVPRTSDVAGGAPEETIIKLGTTPQYLFCGFWDSFWTEYAGCMSPNLRVHTELPRVDAAAGLEASNSFPDDIGSVFGDFRGVFLSGEFVRVGAADSLRWRIDRPFVKRTKVDRAIPFADVKERETVALADSLRVMLEAAHRSDGERRENRSGEPDSFRPEYSAARFLDARVLYLSSLAAHRRSKARGGGDRFKHEPLRYLVFVPRRNRWQLGRLIERLHLLDTYRLASLIELTALNDANDSLKRFNELARNAATSDDLIYLNDELARIEAMCDGGLGYRIERARRYISGFRASVTHLRTKRVESYQPYDEFVYRRIGSSWEFINRLGDRLQRARGRLDSISVKMQTLEQQNQTAEQTKLLAVAELVSVVPIGYYGGVFLASLAAMLGYRTIDLYGHSLDGEAKHWLFAVVVMVLYVLLLLVLRLVPGQFPARPRLPGRER